MGIAIASGAPPAAGLITGIIGGLVTGALSGCPLQVSGPAAGLAVIVFEIIQKHGFASLVPILVLAGLIQVGAGVLRVGQFFRAMAPAVVYGMLAGIGILIFGAQFHVMVDDKPRENGLLNLISIPESIQKGVFPVDGSSHHIAAVLGLTTIIMLVGWASLAPKKLKWIPGALVAVVVATAMAQILKMPVKYVNVPDNLLGSIQLPTLSSIAGAFSVELLLVALTLAFVASAETLLSATAVDQMHDGTRTNYDKELRAQGVGNILAGLAGGLPMTGVIVRSATNVAAGARTRMSAMMHGVWLLILVGTLPWVLRMVPTASLAAVLVYTGYKLVNPANVKRLMQYGAFPVVIYAATVIMIVATDLLTGILVGIGLSIVKILYGMSHMHIRVTRDPVRNAVDVHVIGAATFVRMPKLVDTLEALPRGVDVRIHLGGVSYVDHAAMEAIASWEKQRVNAGSRVIVSWDDLRQIYWSRNGFRPTPAAEVASTR
jgi:MFS superfamily sulfate permease-like transporter